MNGLYTIGYAAFDNIDIFIQTLKNNNVNVIADVRSVPRSRYKPEFSDNSLKNRLKKSGIMYVFLGDSCGARINDPSCYTDGHVSYERIKETSIFKQGINRILNGLNKYSIALLCAEKDPIYCHRDILVCRNLKPFKINIQHIISDKIIETNESAEDRLLKEFDLDTDDLFMSDAERLDSAYDQQGERIAYKLQSQEVYNI
ncbi:MAG: DUF488 domain-containing protein [Treponema sp.]|jgi:uncharacterized protein (DUF488 family)|nr:DUF488 domain-containing protein [Treponema sp.]